MSDTGLPFGSIHKTRERRTLDHGRMVAAANARRAVIAVAARLDHRAWPVYADAPMVAFDTGKLHGPRECDRDCGWGDLCDAPGNSLCACKPWRGALRYSS